MTILTPVSSKTTLDKSITQENGALNVSLQIDSKVLIELLVRNGT